jgi:hypothetical protein
VPISRPTVFVLGAGASHPFGFPLGIELRNEICAFRLNKKKIDPLLEIGYSENEEMAFLDDLRESAWTSVDVYLEKNSHFMEIGKRAIAAALLPCESSDRLFPPSAPVENWYELLANVMKAGTPEWKDNAVAFITFNYDRSIEYYFTRVIARRMRISQEDALAEFNRMKLIHVHGSLGSFLTHPFGDSLSSDHVRLAAENILIVPEVDDTLPTYGEAFALLKAAERIFFFGFGFNADTVRRLRFFDEVRATTPRQIEVCITKRGLTDRDKIWIRHQILKNHWTEPNHQTPFDFLRNARLD